MEADLLSDSEFNAVASRISERKRRIAELMREIDTLRAHERKLKAFLNEDPIDPVERVEGGPEIRPSSPFNEILDAAEKALREKGDTMFSGEILEKITEQGVHVGGENPVGNLATKLGRSKGRIISNGHRRGWRLPVWP